MSAHKWLKNQWLMSDRKRSAGPRNRVPPSEKNRGDGLDRRPPVGTAARRAAKPRIAVHLDDTTCPGTPVFTPAQPAVGGRKRGTPTREEARGRLGTRTSGRRSRWLFASDQIFFSSSGPHHLRTWDKWRRNSVQSEVRKASGSSGDRIVEEVLPTPNPASPPPAHPPPQPAAVGRLLRELVEAGADAMVWGALSVLITLLIAVFGFVFGT